ncbi:PI-PLC X domain-containing protein At5g67130, partial [Linum perenne]
QNSVQVRVQHPQEHILYPEKGRSSDPTASIYMDSTPILSVLLDRITYREPFPVPFPKSIQNNIQTQIIHRFNHHTLYILSDTLNNQSKASETNFHNQLIDIMGIGKKMTSIRWLLAAALILTWSSTAALGCSSDQDCGAGRQCLSCLEKASSGAVCVRSATTNQFQLLNNSLPFNKYAFLTTHNAFAINNYPLHTPIPRLTETNQEDTITEQLNNGVRALMLDTYDFQGDVWMCHSFGGNCHDFTAFGPAIDYLKEVEAFMSANPSEVVTIILEDYVRAANGLTKVFTDAGLMKYWFPVSKMPENGSGDWPLVSDMVKNNQRLIVFTSDQSKESSEGVAYQWTYMVENQCKYEVTPLVILPNCIQLDLFR